MLKRSFAEFHAQKAQPESRLALERGQKALAAVKARPLPEAMLGTTREDVRQFHNISQDIRDLSDDVQVTPPPPPPTYTHHPAPPHQSRLLHSRRSASITRRIRTMRGITQEHLRCFCKVRSTMHLRP